MFDHAKGTVVRKNRTRIARSGCCNPLARDVLQSARLQTEDLQDQKRREKKSVLVQSPHMHTLSLRTLPEDDHSANFLSAGSQIDPISIFPLLQRTVCWVTYLVLHKRFLSWYLKKKKHLREKKPQIKSQISSLLRMSWPRVEEEKRKKSSEAKAEDQRRLEKNWSKSDCYFGSGKLQIGTIMLTPPPPWNIFGWQNPLIDSLWWWMLPLRVDPGNFSPPSL